MRSKRVASFNLQYNVSHTIVKINTFYFKILASISSVNLYAVTLQISLVLKLVSYKKYNNKSNLCCFAPVKSNTVI